MGKEKGVRVKGLVKVAWGQRNRIRKVRSEIVKCSEIEPKSVVNSL
jgi:hypothetical protein